MNDNERQLGLAVVSRLIAFARVSGDYKVVLSYDDVAALLHLMEESSNVSRAILEALDIMRSFVDVVVEDRLTHDELLELADMTKENAALFAGAIGTTVVEG